MCRKINANATAIKFIVQAVHGNRQNRKLFVSSSERVAMCRMRTRTHTTKLKSIKWVSTSSGEAKLSFCFSNRFRPHQFLSRFGAHVWFGRTSSGSCWVCLLNLWGKPCFYFFPMLRSHWIGGDIIPLDGRLRFNGYLVLSEAVRFTINPFNFISLGVSIFSISLEVCLNEPEYISQSACIGKQIKKIFPFLDSLLSTFVHWISWSWMGLSPFHCCASGGNVLMMSFIRSLPKLFCVLNASMKDSILSNLLSTGPWYAGLLLSFLFLFFGAHWIISAAHTQPEDNGAHLSTLIWSSS